jgi:CRP-like cAMP-binding protein
MFLGVRFPVSAFAAEDTRLCVIDRAGFESKLRDSPELALGMLAAVSTHLHHLIGQVEQLKTQNGRQRLAGFLLAQCGRRDGPCRIKLPYDKMLIASRLGMTPESFSRALSRLRTDGVSVEGDEILVDDPIRLGQLTRQPKYRRA